MASKDIIAVPHTTIDIHSVEALLRPISSDRPCGEDLEYDPAFLELERSAKILPERQVGATIIAAQVPEWHEVMVKALVKWLDYPGHTISSNLES